MKPRYIRVVSDLHLEQEAGQKAGFLAQLFVPNDARDKESVLVLAGDISSKPQQLVEFLHQLKNRFLRIFYVPGNHEFYGHEMLEWSQNFRATMQDLPTIAFSTLDVEYEEHENVRFIFGTMWGHGGKTPSEKIMVGRGLRDFYAVKVQGDNEPRRFTVPDMEAIYKRHKAQIEGYLQIPFDGITTVVTHHLPSYRMCHPRFGTDINGGFAGNCDDILAKTETAPQLWIHGHTHDTCDGIWWKTRVVCNPSGYFFENDARYKNFKPTFIDLENVHGNVE